MPSKLYTHAEITKCSFPLDRSTEKRRHSQSTHAVHHGQVTSEWPRWTNEEHVLTQQVLSTRHRRRHYRQTSDMLRLRKLWIHTYNTSGHICSVQYKCSVSAVKRPLPVQTMHQPLNNTQQLSTFLLLYIPDSNYATPDNYYACRANNSARLSIHNRSHQIFPCT